MCVCKQSTLTYSMSGPITVLGFLVPHPSYNHPQVLQWTYNENRCCYDCFKDYEDSPIIHSKKWNGKNFGYNWS